MKHLIGRELPAKTLVVAIDCGKASHRVMLATGEQGMIGEPVSLPTLRQGVEELTRLIGTAGGEGPPVIAVEATGSLHHAWVAELERRFAGSLRLFAPSETQAARTGLGSRRTKTDDRDCAALITLARQGLGRPPEGATVAAMLGAVRHRRALVGVRKVTQQRLHDQLNALCPGLSAPVGHGRALKLEDSSGQAVLACAVEFAGRAPAPRSLIARAPRRLTKANASYWSARWKALLPPPADAELRARRLGGDLERWRSLQCDIAAVEEQIATLLAATPGEILTSLPGVAQTRAAAFAAHALPIERFPSPEHLYSASGLAPATYESATLRRRGRISRAGLAEFRDALMGIAWGLSQSCGAFASRDRALRERGMAPIQARVALARHACRLSFALLKTQEPFDEERYVRMRHGASGDGVFSYAA
jgi:transposase